MEVEVNYLAVLLAGIVAMIIGALWYSPFVVGNIWRKVVKLDEKKAAKESNVTMGLTVVLVLVMAYVLAHVSYLSNQFFDNSFLQDTLTTSFWLWVGLVVPSIAIGGLFEQRRKKAILLNVGNQLVTLLGMGLVIGLMGV